MSSEGTYYRCTLSRGLRGVFIQRPGSKRFAMTMAIRVGSSDDPVGMDGLAHLVEHLAFSGPNTPLCQDLTRRGLYLTGLTDWYKTQFKATGHICLFSQCLECFFGILGSTVGDAHAIRDEIGILTHEYSARIAWETNSMRKIERLWLRMIGDARKPLALQKHLTSLRQVDAEQVKSFRDTYYVPSNTCLVLLSPLAPAELRAQIERHLDRMPSVGQPRRIPRSAAAPGEIQNLVVLPARGRQTQIQIWHRTCDLQPHLLAAIRLLRDILSGEPHGFFFRTVRSERQLAYEADSWIRQYPTCLVFGSHALIQRAAVRPTLDLILSELNRIRSSGLEQAAFEEAQLRSIRRLEWLEEEWLALSDQIVEFDNGLPDTPIPVPHDLRIQTEALDSAHFNRTVRDLLDPKNRMIVITGTVGPLEAWRIRRLIKRLS
jgi:predicted Zn-dependent peptidase